MTYKAKMPENRVWKERLEWCKEQFGPPKEYGNALLKDARWWRLTHDKGYLRFRNESDYLLYLLRWS